MVDADVDVTPRVASRPPRVVPSALPTAEAMGPWLVCTTVPSAASPDNPEATWACDSVKSRRPSRWTKSGSVMWRPPVARSSVYGRGAGGYRGSFPRGARCYAVGFEAGIE